jgi:hypothetical protein
MSEGNATAGQNEIMVDEGEEEGDEMQHEYDQEDDDATYRSDETLAADDSENDSALQQALRISVWCLCARVCVFCVRMLMICLCACICVYFAGVICLCIRRCVLCEL